MLYMTIVSFFIIIGIIKKNNIYMTLLGVCLIVYMFINVSPAVPDYGNYMSYFYAGERYRNLLPTGFETISLYIWHRGYSFLYFRFVLGTMVLIIVWVAAKIWTKNTAWVVAAYLVTFFPMDLMQLKNFSMMGFSVLGIAVLANRGKSKYIVSLFCIWLGTQFHTLGVVFIPLVLMMLIPDELLDKLYYKYTIIFSSIFLIFLTAGSKITFLNNISKIISQLSGSEEDHVVTKLINRYSAGTSLSVILVIILTNIIIWYVIGKITSNDKLLLMERKQKLIEKIMKNLGIYILILSPVMLIAPDYSRIFRNLGYLEIMFFIFVIGQKNYTIKSKKLAKMGLVILFISGISLWGRYISILFVN